MIKYPIYNVIFTILAYNYNLVYLSKYNIDIFNYNVYYIIDKFLNDKTYHVSL